jgi:hypothetical protein
LASGQHKLADGPAREGAVTSGIGAASVSRLTPAAGRLRAALA